MTEFIPQPTDALIIIDVQSDFIIGGQLAVPHGEDVIDPIEALADKFDNIVLTQDWHPQGHKSFASSHVGKSAFDMTTMPYGEQVLWPDHCVQGTLGAELALSGELQSRAQLIIRKGFRPQIDSYSAFLENDKTTPTGLKGYLDERGIKRVFFVGLALDYCVAFSAIDAAELGFESVVIKDACRGITEQGVAERMMEMQEKGVTII